MAISTTPSGGPQGEFSTYVPIAAQTLTSTAATVTFNNIPQTYTDLVLVVTGKVTSAASLYLRFNGNTSGVYSYTSLDSGGSGSPAGYRVSNQGAVTYGVWRTTNSSQYSVVQLQNYSNTTLYKTFFSRSYDDNSTNRLFCGLYRSTDPITKIEFIGDTSYDIGCTFTLYGIKAAASQFIPSKATGGDLIATDGTYAYHAFTTSGTFIPAQTLTADILVVAGGGGGQKDVGGGGGAGGVLAKSGHSFTSGTNYVCTIGAGGATGDGTATSGGDTSVNALFVAYGGGKGGYYNNNAPANGGSGGGGGGTNSGASSGGTSTQTAQNGATGYGNAGGQGVGSNVYTAGGGGGAGVAGASGNGYNGGNGGNGLSTWSSWLTPLNMGVNGYIAGGGGGGSGNGGTQSTGGLGGGGNGKIRNGSYSDSYSHAVTNTGSGGGGCGGTGVGIGGNGSSGFVIVRYAL